MDIAKLQKGADAVLERLVNAMRGGSGEIHPQSLVCAVGSLAGYACQKDVRVMFMKKNHLTEDQIFTVMTDKQGRKLFFGDLLNEPLVNEKLSVWSMIGGAVKQRGGTLQIHLLHGRRRTVRQTACMSGGRKHDRLSGAAVAAAGRSRKSLR